MAGLWGIKRENYRASLRAGLELISTVRDGPFQIGTTECSTCKMQMEQGSTKPTVHPIKLLALAYGLMPEIEDLVRSSGQSLVVT
jgi:Fe-S oxidoreductase